MNSKEQKKIGSARAVDAEGSAEEGPTANRFPTDGANWRSGSPAMPTVKGLGLVESCRLALDIGKVDKQKAILPRFGALER